MDYKIITAPSAERLTALVAAAQKDGWIPIGGHQVVEKNKQLIYAGSSHTRTECTAEYSQTLNKI